MSLDGDHCTKELLLSKQGTFNFGSPKLIDFKKLTFCCTLRRIIFYFVLQQCTVTEVTLETEVLLYTWQDLVADISGTLGLFLGFSFMTLWDGLAKLKQLTINAKQLFYQNNV